jgi:hypothetical protein
MNIGELLLSLLSLTEVQVALVGAVLAVIAGVVAKNARTKQIIDLALLAYEFAEEKGLAQGLKAYQKLDPFIDEFTRQWRDKFGSDPLSAIIGKAVAIASDEAAARKN